jgi:putative aldouronate transport system substrate-binding protein
VNRLIKKVLPLILVTAIFSACSAKTKDSATEAPATSAPSADVQATPSPAMVKTNEFGWEVPEKTIKFEIYGGKDNPDKIEKNQKRLHDFLVKHFNVDIKKFVYDIDQKQKLSLMLASNDYPEVITGLTEEDALKFVDQGKAIVLNELIDKSAPNIKSKLGGLYSTYLNDKGQLHYLPTFYGYMDIPDYSAAIRYDWWKEIGSPAFETPDEYYNVLKQMQAKHPKNDKGEPTYALSGYDKSGSMLEFLTGVWGLKKGFKEDADHNLVHWLNTPEGLEMTQWINKVYREGMLDPDTFINKFDDWRAKFSAQRMMGSIGGWWIGWNAGHEVWQKSVPNWNDEMRFLQVNVKATGVEKATLSPKNARGDQFTIITDKAKNPEEIIKWMNFSVTDIGNRLNGWGVPDMPGETYDYSVWSFENGKPALIEAQSKLVVAGTFDFVKGDTTGWGSYSLVQGIYPMGDDGKSVIYYDQNFNDQAIWKKKLNENLKGTSFDNTLQTIAIPPSSPEGLKDQQIQDAINSMWPRAVLAKTPEASKAAFEELVSKANSIGLGDIQKYRTDVYKDRMGKWKLN